MAASSSSMRKRKPDSPPPQAVLQKKDKFPVEEAVGDYQVFLSFRGPDTRYNFTDVLYDYMNTLGIRVFRDDDEISIGQPIDKILKAIESSEVCVPILSENFASSAWCLREVRKMVKMNKTIIPIFYKVTPKDVKLETELYKSAAANHVSKYGNVKVDKWKSALKVIAGIKGREIREDTRRSEFYKSFVNRILSLLKPRQMYDVDPLFGLDYQIEYALELLDIDSSDVFYVVIHGMGGIGKTTLAKSLCNKVSHLFEHHCFLESVRESSQGNGLRSLQRDLQEQLEPGSSNRSGFSFRRKFGRNKVLVVLDDVDKWDQIETLAGRSSWFGPGSRIIVTSRNNDVMNRYVNHNEVRQLEMKLLQENSALELFSQFAFRNNKRTHQAVFSTYSNEIVSKAGGLPLALKVIGSLLHGVNDETIWRDVIKKLGNVSINEEVKERLMISYDALGTDEKRIFIDIACLGLYGSHIRDAIYMWEALGLAPHLALQNLARKSLIKFVEDGHIMMHDQLKDLGRCIVHEENHGDPRIRHRIIREDREAWDVLTSEEGKEMVETLSLSREGETLTDKHFAGFKQLRFLRLDGPDIVGDLDNLLPKLLWFSWKFRGNYVSNIIGSCMKNLVILNLSHNSMDNSWLGWSLIQLLSHLKVLNLSYCYKLTSTPVFGENEQLERLLLSNCDSLCEIHGSIGNLKSLKILDLTNCHSLEGLPDDIVSLEGLEQIVVTGNYSLETDEVTSCLFELPDRIGNLKSLTILKLEDVWIDYIPHSIGYLTKLKCLSLKNCGIGQELPESFGGLVSLTELDLSDCLISKLPCSIGQLVKLETLNLENCHLVMHLPDSVGNLKSLHKLSLSGVGVTSLPNYIGGMEKLKRLNISCTRLKSFPQSILMLTELEEICANDAHLEELPQEIDRFASLRRLDLSNVPMPDLSNLKRLSKVGFCNFHGLDNLGVGELKFVKEVSIENCSIEVIEQCLLKGLLSLYISLCESLNSLPSISHIRNLRDLTIKKCKDLVKVTGLDELTSLEYLFITDCDALESLEIVIREPNYDLVS